MAAVKRRQNRRSKKPSITIVEVSDQVNLAGLQLHTKRYGHRTSETCDATKALACPNPTLGTSASTAGNRTCCAKPIYTHPKIRPLFFKEL